MAIEQSLPKISAAPDPAVEIRPVYVEEAAESLTYDRFTDRIVEGG